MENVYFRAVLIFLLPGIERGFPKARNTIRTGLLVVFPEEIRLDSVDLGK
jgi:hypothetical protein